MYHIGHRLCGELSEAGCEGSSLCRLRDSANAAAAAADSHKYTFNKMILESGRLKLVYDRLSPPPSCGGN